MRINITPRTPPYKVKINASYPFPWSNNLCPGNTDNEVSSSGAPKKIDGIKSRKVCVIDIATMNITRVIGEIAEKKGKEARRNAETRFT